jgi:hypothetical protein
MAADLAKLLAHRPLLERELKAKGMTDELLQHAIQSGLLVSERVRVPGLYRPRTIYRLAQSVPVSSPRLAVDDECVPLALLPSLGTPILKLLAGWCGRGHSRARMNALRDLASHRELSGRSKTIDSALRILRQETGIVQSRKHQWKLTPEGEVLVGLILQADSKRTGE